MGKILADGVANTSAVRLSKKGEEEREPVQQDADAGLVWRGEVTS